MIGKKILLNLYREMLRIRLIEEAIAQKYHDQEMRCPTHLCIGQEAIPVGVCANLKPSDIVMSNHRSHGHYLAKGGSLKKMIAEIMGKATGCSRGRGGSQHLIDLSVNFYGATPIVGGAIPVAAGISWASLMKRQRKVTVVFLGDAATDEGVFHESINFAVLKKLPILFVCENNFYSILTHITQRQPDREIYSFVKAHGLMAEKEDGNNVIKVYTSAKKALTYIRKGKGPAFLEYQTYRTKEHCGPLDEPEGWRPKNEVINWQKKDPVEQMKKYLQNHKLINQQQLQTFKDKINQEINQALVWAQNSQFSKDIPSVKQVFK